MCIGTQISLYYTITFSGVFRQCAICINLSVLFYSQLLTICNRLNLKRRIPFVYAVLIWLPNLPNINFPRCRKIFFASFRVYYLPADVLYSSLNTKFPVNFMQLNQIFISLLNFRPRCVILFNVSKRLFS